MVLISLFYFKLLLLSKAYLKNSPTSGIRAGLHSRRFNNLWAKILINKMDFSHFSSMCIKCFSLHIELWKVIVLDLEIFKNGDSTLKKYEDFNNEDCKSLSQNIKATQLLYCSLNPEEYNWISSCEHAKKIWEMLEVTH